MYVSLSLVRISANPWCVSQLAKFHHIPCVHEQRSNQFQHVWYARGKLDYWQYGK